MISAIRSSACRNLALRPVEPQRVGQRLAEVIGIDGPEFGGIVCHQVRPDWQVQSRNQTAMNDNDLAELSPDAEGAPCVVSGTGFL